MTENFADRLLAAIAAKQAPVVVGIDPVYNRIPEAIVGKTGLDDEADLEAALDAVLEFSRRVIRIVAAYVPAVKINTAYFERYYAEGIEVYFELIEEAAEKNLIVISDCKRGDVGHTAQMYAKAMLADPDLAGVDDLVGPDAVTVNAYLGWDAVAPFVDVAKEDGKGIFVLVRTSNPSAAAIQNVETPDGITIAEHIADLVAQWGSDKALIGQSGYSSLGAVVAPRDLEQAQRIRERLDKAIFLVPGYGAQGLQAEQVAACFKPDGTGAIVNASRSIIYAHDRQEYSQLYPDQWERCVDQACQDFVKEIRQVANLT